MKWTFGIVTDGSVGSRVVRMIMSIVAEVPDAEVIVVGGTKDAIQNEQPHCVVDNIYHIPFAEDAKPAWITRKKNLIAQHASNNNICIMHDYVGLGPGWASGFEIFGEDWLTCTNKIQNLDGTRFRDWCVLHHDAWMYPPIDDKLPPDTVAGSLVPYDQKPDPRWQYYSGAYFCSKKSVLIDVPFDETRSWGQGEDVQWSRLIYKTYGSGVFNFNPHSIVRFLKQKDRAHWENGGDQHQLSG